MVNFSTPGKFWKYTVYYIVYTVHCILETYYVSTQIKKTLFKKSFYITDTLCTVKPQVS